MNAALIRMFQPKGVSQPGPQSGLRLSELFPSEVAPGVAADIWRLARKADRMGTTTAQMEIPCGGSELEVGVTVASMTGSGQMRLLGYVIVFEDLSDLLQGAEAGRLARGGAPGGARDQESADADCTVGRTHPAAH